MASASASRVETATNGKRWHDDYPELGTGPVPTEPYISEEYFALERERLFPHVWLNVGREEEIAKPGDYLVKDLAVCNASILVTRGKDGKVRAFHNVCSHRSNKLVWNGRGSCQTFTCRFHGWAYNPAGKLTFVPDEDNFFRFEKKDHGLTPVAADIWEGFIFIHLDPQPRESLKDYLGEFGEAMHGYPFSALSEMCYSWTTEINTNWKNIRDAFQEINHLPFLHGRSVPGAFSDSSNPYAHNLDFKLYPRHHRTSLYGNPNHRPTATEAVVQRFGSTLIRKDYSSIEHLPAGVNPTRDPAWSFDLNVIFPNFNVHIGDGTYLTYNMFPLAVDRTLWEVREYYPRPKSAGERFSQEYGKVMFRDILLEDSKIMEQAQVGMASKAKPYLILKDEELLIRHDNQVREDYIGFYRNREKGREEAHG